jgi:hypothetical protein
LENLVEILRSFGITSSLKINWEKNVVYYIGASQARPSWLQNFHWKYWAQDGDISKLLGCLFGLGLEVGTTQINFYSIRLKRNYPLVFYTPFVNGYNVHY